MSESPPEAQSHAQGQGASLLLSLVPGLLQQTAQHAERLAALERTTGDYASRTDGRMSALQQQVQHLDDRLDAQDAESARQWQQIRSQLGTAAAQLSAMQASEAERQRLAHAAEEEARARAIALAVEARERHKETVARIHRIVGGALLFVASCTWPLLAGLPVQRRMIALGVGCALVSVYAALIYYRSRGRNTQS